MQQQQQRRRSGKLKEGVKTGWKKLSLPQKQMVLTMDVIMLGF
jgi:hypothetical protein